MKNTTAGRPHRLLPIPLVAGLLTSLLASPSVWAQTDDTLNDVSEASTSASESTYELRSDVNVTFENSGGFSILTLINDGQVSLGDLPTTPSEAGFLTLDSGSARNTYLDILSQDTGLSEFRMFKGTSTSASSRIFTDADQGMGFENLEDGGDIVFEMTSDVDEDGATSTTAMLALDATDLKVKLLAVRDDAEGAYLRFYRGSNSSGEEDILFSGNDSNGDAIHWAAFSHLGSAGGQSDGVMGVSTLYNGSYGKRFWLRRRLMVFLPTVAPASIDDNHAGISANSAGALLVSDSNGNTTQISSHRAFDPASGELLPSFRPVEDGGVANPFSLWSANEFTGWESVIDVARMAQILEERSGENLLHEFALPEDQRIQVDLSEWEKGRDDWLVEQEREKILKENPMVEITMAEAVVEADEVVYEVRPHETNRFAYDTESEMVTEIREQALEMVPVSTGRKVRQLLPNVEFDTHTGRFFRYLTAEEIEVQIDAPELAPWVRNRAEASERP